MQRSIALGLMIVLLAGCATFSTSDTDSQSHIPERDTTPVSVQQMRLLQIGEWYEVRLPEKEGRSGAGRGVYYNGYVGRLQSSDEDSLTLADVVKCTSFDYRSTLRYLPVVGSNYENGWSKMEKVTGTVTVPRTEVMWFEPISATEGDNYQRCDEISQGPFELAAEDIPEECRTPYGIIDPHRVSADFLLPNQESEERRVQKWIEAREVKPGHWYNVLPAPERRYTFYDIKIHMGVVDHVDEDGIHLINVTTCSKPRDGSPDRIETTAEMMLRFSEIDKVIALTPEWLEKQRETFSRAQAGP